MQPCNSTTHVTAVETLPPLSRPTLFVRLSYSPAARPLALLFKKPRPTHPHPVRTAVHNPKKTGERGGTTHRTSLERAPRLWVCSGRLARSCLPETVSSTQATHQLLHRHLCSRSPPVLPCCLLLFWFCRLRNDPCPPPPVRSGGVGSSCCVLVAGGSQESRINPGNWEIN